MTTRFPDTPFTWPMARDLGVLRGDLDCALLDGRLTKVVRGVYVTADRGIDHLARIRAARLVVSDHSVVCDRSAAWIWGVDCFRYSELDGRPRIESCVLRGHEPTERDEVVGVTRDLVPADWVELDGLRVTTPLRTAFDLGCQLVPHVALGVMDALMRAHAFTHDDMRLLLRRYRRRRGVIQLRRLVAVVDPRAESQPESWVRWFIIDEGLPHPVPQVWVRVEGEMVRLDLCYERARILVEYDGEEFHSSREAQRHDERRRDALRRAGWIVIVVRKADLGPDARSGWLRELADALRERRVR